MMWRRLRWVGGWGAVGGDMVGREKEHRREESTDEARWWSRFVGYMILCLSFPSSLTVVFGPKPFFVVERWTTIKNVEMLSLSVHPSLGLDPRRSPWLLRLSAESRARDIDRLGRHKSPSSVAVYIVYSLLSTTNDLVDLGVLGRTSHRRQKRQQGCFDSL